MEFTMTGHQCQEVASVRPVWWSGVHGRSMGRRSIGLVVRCCHPWYNGTQSPALRGLLGEDFKGAF